MVILRRVSGMARKMTQILWNRGRVEGRGPRLMTVQEGSVRLLVDFIVAFGVSSGFVGAATTETA